jgi:hypothetical protein
MAQNKPYSVLEIAQMVTKELKYKVKFIMNKKYPDGAPFRALDDTLFRKKNPDFKFTLLNNGIRKTIKYYEGLL